MFPSDDNFCIRILWLQATESNAWGGRQESGRFSSGKDTGWFTIATKKSNSAGEAEVPLQGSRQGDNTDTHQGAAVGRNRLCSTQESKSNRAQPGSYAHLSARGGHSNLMTVPQRPHTPGKKLSKTRLESSSSKKGNGCWAAKDTKGIH